MDKCILGIPLQSIYLQGVWRQRLSLVTGIVLLVVSGTGHATVIGGSSSSYVVGGNVSVTLLTQSLLDLDIAATPASSGTAPSAYDVSESGPSLNVQLNSVIGSVGSIGADMLDTHASSNIDGSAGVKFATASASVADIGFSLSDLVSLNLGTVKSTASVSGDFGALTPTGETILDGVELSIAGKRIALIDIPAPNTVVDLSLLGLAGSSLILNEQILTGDGVSELGLVVNAIHLSFNTFLHGFFSLTGDIIISHAQAQITAEPGQAAAPVALATIPEPGTLALLSSGFAILSWKSRRKAAASLA